MIFFINIYCSTIPSWEILARALFSCLYGDGNLRVNKVVGQMKYFIVHVFCLYKYMLN